MVDKIKLLMVDDERRFRETTRKILSKKGFETLLADNGQEALEQVKQNPDVVILDIRMPGMDGHEVLRRIKRDKPDLPVIMLTGHGGKPSAEDALVEGAFDYLTKPCDIDILARKINEAVQMKKEKINGNEVSVCDVMIPIDAYTTIEEGKTLEEAVQALQKSFESKMTTGSLMETGHRSILAVDKRGGIKGILTIRDMLEVLMPGYLSVQKPFMADSIEFSPMFWNGMFTLRIREKKRACISEIMSPSPLTIDGHANLMEAAYFMVHRNERRLLVMRNGKPAGILREQDLFFEMVKVMTS